MLHRLPSNFESPLHMRYVKRILVDFGGLPLVQWTY
jgi:hypothetical protein